MPELEPKAKSGLFTKRFWRAAADRAARTVAQGLIALLGSDVFGWISLDWAMIGLAAGIMGLLSVLNSIIMSPPEASS